MSDPLAALLHNIHTEGPPYECEHDSLPEGHPVWFAPRCIEEAARIRASGVRLAAPPSDPAAPIPWVDPKTCRTCGGWECTGHPAPSDPAAPNPRPTCGHYETDLDAFDRLEAPLDVDTVKALIAGDVADLVAAHELSDPAAPLREFIDSWTPQHTDYCARQDDDADCVCGVGPEYERLLRAALAPPAPEDANRE